MRRRTNGVRMTLAFAGVAVVVALGLNRQGDLPTVNADPLSADANASARKLNTLDALQRYFYLKRQADARYLKIREAANLYIKRTDADKRYIKFSDADARFLKIEDAAGIYIKMTDADARFLKIEDAAKQFLKIEDANNTFIKFEDANARFVHGSASSFTGARLVGDANEPLLTIPGTLKVEANTPDAGKSTTVTLTNLTNGPLTFAQSPAPPAGGGAGTIGAGQSQGILIGLNQPSTIQLIGAFGDGSVVPAVQTVMVTGFDANGQVQVVGQALSGAPGG